VDVGQPSVGLHHELLGPRVLMLRLENHNASAKPTKYTMSNLRKPICPSDPKKLLMRKNSSMLDFSVNPVETSSSSVTLADLNKKQKGPSKSLLLKGICFTSETRMRWTSSLQYVQILRHSNVIMTVAPWTGIFYQTIRVILNDFMPTI